MGICNRGGVLDSPFEFHHPNGTYSALCLGSRIWTQRVLCFIPNRQRSGPYPSLPHKSNTKTQVGFPASLWKIMCWREKGWEYVWGQGLHSLNPHLWITSLQIKYYSFSFPISQTYQFLAHGLCILHLPPPGKLSQQVSQTWTWLGPLQLRPQNFLTALNLHMIYLLPYL